MNIKIYIETIFLIFLGVVTTLSLPPFNFFLINFLTFSLFFLFLKNKASKHKNKKLFFLYGWLFGFGYFLTNLYWIPFSLKFDKNFEHLIPFVIIFLPSILAIFYGIISYVFIILKPNKVLYSFFSFSLIFAIVEYVRGFIFTGFPWNLIVYSFSNQIEFLSVLRTIGTYGLNLFCISLFTSPALIIIKRSKKNLSVSLIFFIIALIFYVYGSFSHKQFEDVPKKNNDYKIRIIGSNISLDRFYLDIDKSLVINELIKLSDPIKDKKTIFVWPEGILPNVYQGELTNFNSLFKERFSENHLLILGINKKIKSKKNINYFNSLTVYDNKLNLISSYNKINLVPFGEFMPFENILKKIGLSSLTNNYQSFSKGNKRKIIDLTQKKFPLKILPLICYEIIYSGKINTKEDFDIIINISEDGWFGKSIGPKQHFSHSIFRAIENGKYILRSSNNGIAGIINPLGVVEKSIKFGDSGFIDFEKSRKIQPTIFSKYGNKIFGMLILLYILLMFSFIRIKNE